MAVMLSVVIPLFNEEDNIAPLQAELATALAGREYELVLVDDCSTDKTLERIERGPNVRVIAFAKNTGQSAAMYVGCNAAKGDIIVLLDGDRQNDPNDIPLMLAKLEEGYDLVCGWRVKRQDNWSRKSAAASRTSSAAGSRATASTIPVARSKSCGPCAGNRCSFSAGCTALSPRS